jgi:hypothetical protein
VRRRLFLKTVARMRSGLSGDWATDRYDYDKVLVKRLFDRVAYGGRKGHRAFLRLWDLRIRPSATKVSVIIKGFEL